MRRAAALAFALPLSLCSCQPVGDPVEIQFDTGDIVVFATASDEDEPKVEDLGFFVASSSADAHAFVARRGAPFYLFRMKAAEFAGAAGELSTSDLARVQVRRADAKYDESCETKCDRERHTCSSGASDACDMARATCISDCYSTRTGDCGRCLVPASTPPQIVNDGDSCKLPAFAGATLYRPQGDGWIAQIDAPSKRAAENAKQSIRLDWPRACACGQAGATQPSLSGMKVRPIAPEGSPWPLAAFAQNDQGVVGGFSERVAMAFDPAVSPPLQSTLELTDYPGSVRAAVVLRDGRFLVAAERYEETMMQGYRFDRYTLGRDGAGHANFGPPEYLDTSAVARPATMKYLSETADFPLWMIGSATANFAIYDAAMFACRDSTLQCIQANVSLCAGDQNTFRIQDAVILSDGSGAAVSDHGLYFKGPNIHSADPAPEDPWSCNTFSDPIAWRPGVRDAGEAIVVEHFHDVASIGQRVFFCGYRQPPHCASWFPVVMTATVGAAPGEMPSPKFEVVAREGDYVYCKSFLPVPGSPDRVRMLFNNGRTIDFDATGAPVDRGAIGGLFAAGSLPWSEIDALQTGNILARTRENGAYVSDGVMQFEQLYGRSAPERATYNKIIAGDDVFFAFGNPAGIVRVELVREAGKSGFPSTNLSLVGDPLHAIKEGDHIRDAIVDHASTAANPGTLVIFAVGYSDGNPVVPLLRRLRIDPGTDTPAVIGSFEDVVSPETIAGLAVDGITEVGPGKFVAIVQDTRIIEIAQDSARELPLDPAMDFDAHDTDQVETKPVLAPYDCGGGTPRLDAFRDIDGGNGVAWAVGQYGIIMRIAGGHVERFIPTVEDEPGHPLPVQADLATVRAACPDRVLIAGQYAQNQGEVGRLIDVWKIVPKTEPAGECFPAESAAASAEGEEQLVVREVPETLEMRCLNLPHGGELDYTWPRALVADTGGGAIVSDTGWLHRFDPAASGGNLSSLIKVPFGVLSVGENAKGEILFGSSDSRLALGVPGSTLKP